MKYYTGPAATGTPDFPRQIANMFLSKPKTSFRMEIVPAIMTRFMFQPLTQELCDKVARDIETAIDIAENNGAVLRAIPRFSANLRGELCFEDMVYENRSVSQ